MLAEVQSLYGPTNSEARVFFSDQDDAVILAGYSPEDAVMVVVLTTLALMLEQGMIFSIEELRTDWLTIPHRSHT